MTGALDGIRVVEVASYVSGPYAGMLLADMGAEVIKIEAPGQGDPFRGWGRTEYSPHFGSVNRNKKSVTLDLKSESGKRSLLALIRRADVLIENFRAGTMERLGLGYDALKHDNPGLVYCAITGFGESGPYAQRPGFDTIGQATSGLLSLLTDLGSPQPMGISLSDHLSGMVACNGILAALLARARDGQGQRVDTSLLEATVSFCGENAANYFMHGEVPSRATRTRQAQIFAFVGRDGAPFVVHLSSPTKFWEGLTRVVERPEWLSDERFASRDRRVRNYDLLHAALAEVFHTNTREYWLTRLLAEDVPSAPINSFEEVFADPQVEHLGLKQVIEHSRAGRIGLVRNGVRLSRTPTAIYAPPPELGEHTEKVLATLASDAEDRK